MSTTKTEFINNLEHGWNFAIDTLAKNKPKDQNICALIMVYNSAYITRDYLETVDPDDGLCYSIRKFAIESIIEILDRKENDYGTTQI